MGRLEYTQQVEEFWTRLMSGRELTALGVVQRLIWAGRLTDELLERTARAAGVRRRGDYEILTIVRRSGLEFPTPATIASELLTSASGMTAKLDRLEDQGLIERRADNHDRRITRIALTDAGRQLTDEAFVLTSSLYENMLTPLPSEDINALDRALSMLLDRLEALVGSRNPWRTPEP